MSHTGPPDHLVLFRNGKIKGGCNPGGGFRGCLYCYFEFLKFGIAVKVVSVWCVIAGLCGFGFIGVLCGF